MKKTFKILKRTMIIFLSVVAVLAIAVVLFMQFPIFGAAPAGARLERIQASPNFKGGKFVNRSYTPNITEGYSMTKVMWDFLFNKGPRVRPMGVIPSTFTDLTTLPAGDWLVWFGHSSYFIQTDGLKILVDPVFSGNASPLPGTTKAFKGTDMYSADQMPVIDYLLISHDHYDHLDMETMVKMQRKVRKVVCGLGVGAHLEKWDYLPEQIIEMDWDTNIELEKGSKLYGLTARHFSGRGIKRDQSLWISYLLQTPTQKIYIWGDSGYDKHFKEIGDLYGPIDLAILENGQYNVAWKAIHFLPGENLKAAKELKAARVMPVHSGKFNLALHEWDEPLNLLFERNKDYGIPLVTPMIGEVVNLKDKAQTFRKWWVNVDAPAKK